MRKFFLFLFIIITVGVSLFLVLGGISGQRHMVLLGLQEGDSTFLYTQATAQSLPFMFEQNSSPPLMASMEVFVDDGKVYSNPLQCQDLAILLGGGMNRHPRAESGFEGYLTKGSGEAYALNTQNRNTERLGEQEILYEVMLTNAQGFQRRIAWTLQTTNGKLRKEENCKVKHFQIATNPAPGETVVSSQPQVVVELQELVDFFDPTAEIEWNEDQGVLMIKRTGR